MEKPRVKFLSVTKPVAVKDFECAWGWDNPHSIPQGTKYVRVVWQQDNEPIQSDHICVNCWTAD